MSSLRCVVIGGSLGGLSAAVLLARAGVDVNVYERATSDFDARGAGLGVDVGLVAEIIGHPPALGELPRIALGRRVVTSGGSTFEQPSPQIATSYGALWRCLRQALPEGRFHPGKAFAGAAPSGDGRVRVSFEDGETMICDLLVCADGHHSRGRQAVVADEGRWEPSYAGYVLLRGTLEEADLVEGPLREAFTRDAIHIHSAARDHMVAYPIPGLQGEVAKGARRVNWGWYYGASEARLEDELLVDRQGQRHDFTLGVGLCQPSFLDEIRARARRVWAEPYRSLVEQLVARDAIGIHPIREYTPARMARDGIALLGDAAHLASPITGSGARMAMADALTLSRALMLRGSSLAERLACYESLRVADARAIVAMGHDFAARFAQGGAARAGITARSA